MPGAARATIYQHRICVDVDLTLTDPNWGSRWTDDSEDKPGRGFRVQVHHAAPGPPYQVIDWPLLGDSPYVDSHGTWSGCTSLINFDSNLSYVITVRSEAQVGVVTLSAVDDADPPLQAVEVVSNYVPSANSDLAVVVQGDRWNVLVLNTFALSLHNPVVDPTTWTLRLRSGSGSNSASEVNATINYFQASSKFITTHELGHLVSYFVDQGGYGCKASFLADEDNCDGSDAPADAHGMLTKEYQGAAACEGIANFFAAVTFNRRDDPCQIATRKQDFDLDGITDYPNGEPFTCYGDPTDTSDYVTDGDWLLDLINASDLQQCGGTAQHRSTSYDWLRYFWGLWAIEQVDLPDLWAIWDAADGHNWIAGVNPVGEYPNERMEAASYPNFSVEHQNQAVHGLLH